MATYYVDFTTGLDSDTGLSEALAWKTISKVNGATFAAGDSILFKKGETWREQLTVPLSGTAGNVVTFGAYGTGANPIIDGSDVLTGWSTTIPTTVNYLVGASHDDAQDDTFDLSNEIGTLALSRTDANYRSCGMRFTNVAIPQGSTIVSAVLQGYQTTATAISTDVYGEDVDNAANFDAADAWPKDRTRTTATVAWSSTASEGWKSLTITTVVQEIISRAGWSSGNALNIITRKVSAAAAAQIASYDGDAAPKLDITYNATVANVYALALATEPKQVFRNGVRGVKEVSLAALTANYEWFWSAGTLFIYSTTDPSGDSSVWTASQRDYCVLVTDKDYVTIDNLKVTKANYSTDGAGVKVSASANRVGATLSNITADYNADCGVKVITSGTATLGLTLTTITGNLNLCNSSTLQNASIMIAGDGGTITLLGTAISDSYAGSMSAGGTVVRGGLGINLVNVTGTIDGIDIDNSGSSGINIEGGCADLLVSTGSAHDCGTFATGDRNGVAIGCSGAASTNVEVTGLDIYGNTNAGIEISYTTTVQQPSGITISKCILRDGAAQGIAVTGGGGIALEDCLVYGNADHGVLFYTGHEGYEANGSIYNCVIYGNARNGLYIGKASGTVSVTLKNTILSENDTATGWDEITCESGCTLVSDYNCVYHSAGGNFMNWKATGETTWAGWKTASSQDANSINANPTFVDAANDDFHLLTGSPCIGAGTDVGLTTDYDWRRVPNGDAFDIGAFEWTTAGLDEENMRDAMANAIVTLVATGSGTATLKWETAADVALATCNMNATPFGTSVDGVLTANAIVNATVGTTGVIDHLSMYNETGTKVREFTVGTANAEVILATTSVTAGDVLGITGLTMTVPAG